MRIGNKEISYNGPVYIIAEGGVNHNGSFEIAKKLVDAALNVGADAIKFQTFKTELLATENADLAEYQKLTTNYKSQFDMLKELELTSEEFFELKKYCDYKKIDFLSAPHSDKWSADLIDNLNVPCHKLGSGDLTNIPFIKYVASKQKPLIISTGMATLEEVLEAQAAVFETENYDLVLLHCTTSYPCPLDRVNLNSMKTLAKECTVPIGYSDHTQKLETAIIATCLGAVVYEKHLTLDKELSGPDHKSSAEPEEFKEIVRCIRKVRKAGINYPYKAFKYLDMEIDSNTIQIILGSKEKKPTTEEIEIAKIARKSVVAIKNVNKGESLTLEKIGIRRPGEGLAPKFIEQILHKTLRKDICKGDYICQEDLDDK